MQNSKAKASRVSLASFSRLMATVAVLAPGSAAVAQAPDDAGAKQFLVSCGVCHTIERGAAPRQGPNLAGIYGKPAGKQDGAKYSDVLPASGLVWDEATLDRWIEDAQAALPGTTMAYRQRDPDKRKLIIAYLKSLAQ